MKHDHVFAVPGAPYAIDCVITDETGRQVSWINKLTLDELRQRDNNPAIQILTFDEYQAQCVKPHEDEYLARPVQEISDEVFTDMLCVLPPMKWTRYPSEESFQMSELTSGRITEAFVRIDDRCFRFYCIAGSDHTDLIRRVAHLF